jgi:Flp pilus assembly protein TadG
MRQHLSRYQGIVSSERGTSLAETAFASVFLILLVVAVYEFGIIFATYTATINASRVGATFASMHSNPTDELYARYADLARHEMRAAHLDMTRVVVAPPAIPDGDDPGDPIGVTVSYQLQTFTSGMSLPLFGRMGLAPFYLISWTTWVPIR